MRYSWFDSLVDICASAELAHKKKSRYQKVKEWFTSWLTKKI